MIELSWFWLRHQPDTALAAGFIRGSAPRRDGSADRHRRAGPQTPRRLVALCHSRRRSRSRRVQGGMTIDDLTPFQRSQTRRLRRIRAGGDRGSTPRAETRRQKGWSRQPEPDTLEHEGLWSEPTSSTGCEVMRSSELHGKDGLTLRTKRQGGCTNAEMIELDSIHPMWGGLKKRHPPLGTSLEAAAWGAREADGAPNFMLCRRQRPAHRPQTYGPGKLMTDEAPPTCSRVLVKVRSSRPTVATQRRPETSPRKPGRVGQHQTNAQPGERPIF